MQISDIDEKIERSNGAVTKPINGLHDARPGDIIRIGVQGQRQKYTARIKKIVSGGRLMDDKGNVFGRDGVIHRRSSTWPYNTKGKIVSAKHMTQQSIDDGYEEQRRNSLKNYNWDKASPETVTAVFAAIRETTNTHHRFSTVQGSKDSI